jgi:hypothetical protein
VLIAIRPKSSIRPTPTRPTTSAIRATVCSPAARPGVCCCSLFVELRVAVGLQCAGHHPHPPPGHRDPAGGRDLRPAYPITELLGLDPTCPAYRLLRPPATGYRPRPHGHHHHRTPPAIGHARWGGLGICASYLPHPLPAGLTELRAIWPSCCCTAACLSCLVPGSCQSLRIAQQAAGSR